MKVALIVDQAHGAFALEYDNTVGQKNTMRLEALTYENALREARDFLDISADGRDNEGQLWHLE